MISKLSLQSRGCSKELDQSSAPTNTTRQGYTPNSLLSAQISVQATPIRYNTNPWPISPIEVSIQLKKHLDVC